MSKATSRRDFLRKGAVLVAAGMSNLRQINAGAPAPESPLKETPLGAGGSKATSNAWGALVSPGAADELKRFQEERREDAKWLGWWKDNLLRVDFDMLMTDAAPEALTKIDPEGMVATVAEAGLQGFWGYIQDPTGWIYYPTKIGQQFPTLKGRDLVAEYIAACRKHGLKFLGYYSPFEFGLAVTDHPEWRREFVGDPVPSSPRLWGNLCFNRPGALDFYLSFFRESIARYDMDAVWFDDFVHITCGCADCQKRYRQETGRDLPFYQTPQGVDYPDHLAYGHHYPRHPEFGYYFRQVEMWLDQWAMQMRQATKEARPDCVVMFQYNPRGYGGDGSWGYSVGMAKATDVASHDCAGIGYQFQHSIEYKCLRGFSPNLPFDAEMPIGEHHSDEISPKQEGLLKQQFAYVMAHGGGVTYIDDMDYQGRISKKKYQRMKKVNAWCGERFPYLGGVMVSDVGLYLSQESNAYKPEWHHRRWRNLRGDSERGLDFSIHDTGNVALVQAMIRENVPFDALQRNKLHELGRHRVMYLNNVEVLREEEADALRNFVQAGGGLVITHRTGLRDEQYQERSNFLLADLLGADYLETPALATSFVAVRDGDRREGFFSRVDQEMTYFEVHGPQCYVKPRDGVEKLGRIARPRRPFMEDGGPGPGMAPTMQLIDPEEIRQANAGFRYEAEIVTDHPAVVLNEVGKGRVAYLAGFPCYDYVDDIHDLLLALLNWAAGGKLNPTVYSNAPGPVEIITMEQLEKKLTVVHAINWQSAWPAVRAHNVEVGVKSFGRSAKRAFAIEAREDLKLRGEQGQIRMTFPPIEAWETVVIEWA